MCIRMRGGSWLDSGVAGSPVVSGGLVWEGLDFFIFLDMSFWVCFLGVFCCLAGFSGLFWCCFGTVLLLNSY